MLKLLAITFLYSPGIPILYSFATVTFFLQFWVDKFLLIYFYSKTPKYDEFIALKMLKLYKLILFMHIMSSVFMYGYTPMLRDDYRDFLHYIGDFPKNTIMKLEFPLHTEDGEYNFTYIQLYALMGLLALFILLESQRALRRACCGRRTNYSRKVASSDFYGVVTYSTLRHELSTINHYLKRGKAMYEKISNDVEIARRYLHKDAIGNAFDWQTLEHGFFASRQDRPINHGFSSHG